MNKVFPQIRLIGDKEAASKYVRRGLQELFRVWEMRRTSGRPVLQRVVQADENTRIIVQLVNGQEFVDIEYTPNPEPEPEKKASKTFLEPERCPPAFVLYMRKKEYGVDDKDYLIAYNESTGTWVLASTDPYVHTSNTGYWPETDKGEWAGNCDLVLWNGQPGGVGTCGMWGAGKIYTGSTDGESPSYYNWGSGFYIAGLEITMYFGILAAGVFTNNRNEQNYYVLRVYNETLEILKGTMPAPNANGNIDPSWESMRKFTYEDYADNPTYDKEWGPTSGNAFLNAEGVAYFSMPIEKDVVVDGTTHHTFPMCLVKVDLLQETLEVLRDNLDRMPTNTQSGYSDSGGNPGCGNHSQEFYNFGSCSSVDETEPAHNPETEYVNSGGSAAYTNKERPLLLRTFGGLDRLYTYELEIDWSISGSYSAEISGWTFTKFWCADPTCIIDYGTDPYTIGEGPPRGWWSMYGNGSATRTESESGQAIVYVYDYEDGEGRGEEIDSLVVLEIESTINMSHSFRSVKYELNDESAAAQGLVALGNSPQSSNSGPGGIGTVRLTRRQITGHHPQIENSWSYIETSEIWDGAIGVMQEKIIRIVEMGEVVKEVTSQVTASGSMGHPWFDCSVREERASSFDPYVNMPAYTTLFGIAPGSKYGPASNILQNGSFINVASGFVPASQDYTILSQDFHGANRYDGQASLQPKPLNIGAGGMYSEYNLCNMGMGMGYYQTDFMFIDNLYGGGTWGHGTEFIFNGDVLGSVAVHRPFGRHDVRPYICVRKKIHIDEGVRVSTGQHKDDLRRFGQIRGHVLASPASPNDYEEGGGDWQNDVSRTLGYYTDYCMLWTKEVDKYDRDAWKDRADNDEWFIYSNVLSDELIMELTEELSMDIIGIGII